MRQGTALVLLMFSMLQEHVIKNIVIMNEFASIIIFPFERVMIMHTRVIEVNFTDN